MYELRNEPYGNWPVSNHQGDIYLIPIDAKAGMDNQAGKMNQVNQTDQVTKLNYVITFNSSKWLPSFILKFFVERDIISAMKS